MVDLDDLASLGEVEQLQVSVKGPGEFVSAADMKAEKVLEPLRVGKQAINSATEAAVMILRIDDVIASTKSKGPPPGAEGMGGMGGMGGMPGGMPPMM